LIQFLKPLRPHQLQAIKRAMLLLMDHYLLPMLSFPHWMHCMILMDPLGKVACDWDLITKQVDKSNLHTFKVQDQILA